MGYDPRWIDIANMRRFGANSPPNATADAAAIQWAEDKAKQQQMDQTANNLKNMAVFGANLKYGGSQNRQDWADTALSDQKTLLQMLLEESANRNAQRQMRQQLLTGLMGKVNNMDSMGQIGQGLENTNNIINGTPSGAPSSSVSDLSLSPVSAYIKTLWPEGNVDVRYDPKVATLASETRGNGKGTILVNPDYFKMGNSPDQLKASIAHELGHILHNDQTSKRYSQAGGSKNLERQATQEGLSLWVGSGGRPEDFLKLLGNFRADKDHYSGAEDASFLQQQMNAGQYKSIDYR